MLKAFLRFLNQNKKIRRIIRRVFSLFLVHGMADTLYWKNDLSLMFFVFISVVIFSEARSYLCLKL